MRTVVALTTLALLTQPFAACATAPSSEREQGPADVVAQARPLSEVLQGCSVEDDGSRMRCGGVSVVVHEGAWATTFDERAQKKAEDLLAKAAFDDVTVDVLGRQEVLRRARIAAVYGDSHLTTLLFAKAGGGKSGERSFTCEAPADVDAGVDRCIEIVASYLAESPLLAAAADATAATPAPAGAAPTRGGVSFVARTLPLVPGCRAVSAPPGGRLECRAAVVAWRPFKTMPEATAAAVEAAAPYEDIANAEYTADVPCKIAGEAARCSQAKVDGPEPLVVVVGVAWVDGTPIAATCSASVEIVDAAVCGGILTLGR